MKFKEILGLWWEQQKRFLPELKAQARRYGPISDATHLPERIQAQASPIFVLSTGRAGTQFISRLMASVDGLHCEHEAQPELLYTSRWAYEHYGQDDLLAAAFLAARYEHIRNAYFEKKRYLETNNRMSFIASGIAKSFPRAVFIHVMRHPKAFVKSGMLRAWYTGEHLTDAGRIHPQNADNWLREEKIAWLWNETNQKILDFGKKIGPERFISFKSEALFSEPESVKRLFNFLKIPYPGNEYVLSQQAKPANISKQKPESVNLDPLWKTHCPLATKMGYKL